MGHGESSLIHGIRTFKSTCVCLYLDVCYMCDHCMCTLVGSNPCRKLSLLGFAHLVVGPLSGTGPVQATDTHMG